MIVAHELFGVNPDIRGVADDLAAAGYLAVAPEFYHRDAEPGRWLGRDDAGRQEGFGYLNRLGRDQAVADVAAALEWLRSQPGIERVAVIGFSAGGHLAYLAACRLPVSRTAVLYGGWLTSTDIPMSRPTPTLEETPGISGRILYLVGEDDTLIDAGQREQIRAALAAAGVEHEVVSYPGAGHAFFWPGTPPFDEAARDDAWARILALLGSDLPGGNVGLPGHNNSGLSRNCCRQRGKRSPFRMDMTVWEWFGKRTFHHRDFCALAAGDRSTTLIFPARNVAATIGPILDTVAGLRARTGLPSQVVVVDADSPDGTADIARARGAEVYSENELLPEYGPAQGKGDAMWRGLSAARGEIVMFADADTADFGEHFVYGTLGPLLADPAVGFCKAAYRRPFAAGDKSVVDGGGRVTELMAKPMLNRFYPELTGFVQPLAGEFAVRADLLASLPFLTGYGVEIGLLIDVLAEAGLAAMAQVDLGVRQNRHQSLWDLAKMSSVVLHALSLRVPALERQPPADTPGLWAPDLGTLRQPEIYLHAVATQDGLRLDEHLTEVLERPPLARAATVT